MTEILYHIGLDFGTHQSKVCVQNLRERTHRFIDFKRNDNETTFLFPSVIEWLVNDTFSYGFPSLKKVKKEFRFFKMASVLGRENNLYAQNQTYDTFGAEVLSVVYLCYMLFYVKDKCKTFEKSETVDNEVVEKLYRFTVQMGIPTEFMNEYDEHSFLIRRKFETLIYLASKLQKSITDFATFLQYSASDLHQLVYKLNDELHLRIEHQNIIFDDILNEAELMVFPETAAGLNAILIEQTQTEGQKLRIPHGFYIALDIGGGSTDISFFRVDKDLIVYYIASESIHLAVTNIYDEYAKNTDRNLNLQEVEQEIRTQTESEEIYSNPIYKAAVETIIEKGIYKKMQNTFLTKIHSIYGKQAHEKYQNQFCFTYGGGSLLPLLHSQIELNNMGVKSSLNVLPIVANLKLVSEELPDSPNILPDNKLWLKEYLLLVVAYGLSFVHQRNKNIWQNSEYRTERVKVKKDFAFNEDPYFTYDYDFKEDVLHKKEKVNPTNVKLELASPKVLNNYIAGFEITNYLNLQSIKIEKLPSSQWIFFTGKNAEGKTALLQAIAMCLVNEKHIPNHLKTMQQIKIMVRIDRAKHEIGYRKGKYFIDKGKEIRENSEILEKNFLIGFGVSRLKMQTEYDNANLSDSNPAYSLLYQEDGNLQNICEWFKDKYMESQLAWTDEMNLVKELLIKCAPSVKDILIVGSIVKFKTEDNDVEFHQLAAGNKSIIAMLGDMVIRLIRENKNATQLSDLIGIVLIDEIEAHLHPIWQKKIVRLLTELLPNVQFIATTHSPIPLLGAPKDSVVFKLQRNEKQQIEILRVDKEPDFWKLLPNALLSSKIFDMEEILPEGKSEFSALDDAYEVAFNEKVRERLEKFLNNDNL